MATAAILLPSSPTMSTSSFDILSARSRSSTFTDDGEEIIVWDVNDSQSDDSPLASDDDFVVLSRPRSPPATARSLPPATPTTPLPNPTLDRDSQLADNLAQLSLKDGGSEPVQGSKKKNKGAAKAQAKERPKQAATPPRGSPSSKRKNPKRARSASPQSQLYSPTSQCQALSPPPSPVPPVRPAGSKKKNAPKPVARGLGLRPIVDDVSERPDSASEMGDTASVCELLATAPSDEYYYAAASCINAYLADQNSVGRLPLLQSLIIELGLAPTSGANSAPLLPASLTAARAILKARAFLHVGEYLAARQHGPAAAQGVMHKSKSSLIRAIRKNRNPVSLKRIKEAGLQVLLVPCYH